MKKIILVLFFMLFLYTISFAQCTATLSGKVIDHHDRSPLEFAEIYIKELKLGAITDSMGNYTIENVCNGSFTVSCKHLGCDDVITTVTINGNTVQNFYPEHHLEELGLVDVVAVREKEKSTSVMKEITGKELEQKRGLSLGEALKSVLGVNAIQTGGNISKPVIHGLHSNRILILNNGIRQEAQQWGSEHAPEIDPFIANKLTVIKGANAVRYGSDAIGGVILVEPNKLRDSAGMGAELNLIGFSNGRGGTASAMVEQNFKQLSVLSWRLQGTIKKSGNMETPTYFLNNSGMEEYNFSAAMGWNKKRYGAEIFYSQFNTNLAIFAGAHIGNVSDLMAIINGTKNIENDSFSYVIGKPYQHIEHELFKANAFLLTGEKGKLNIVYARQYNLRNEYDAHQSKNNLNKPQLQFEITTHTMDVFWEHNSIKHFTGTIGVNAMQQGNTYEGRYFIPNFRNYTTGIYWIERFTKNNLQVEMGVRYDYRHLQVYKYQNNLIVSPDYTYDNTSGTIGAIYKVNNFLKTNVTIGTAWRAPSVNELHSNGIHHGAATYEIGNENLKTEKSVNAIAGIHFSNHKKWNAEVNAFYNVMNDFIYLKPQFPATVTISGAFPTFVYSQTDALLYGMDAQLSYLVLPQFMLTGKVSLLRAKDVLNNAYLIQMPADRYSAEMTYNFKNKNKISDAYISMSGVYENKQWRVDARNDYMAAPEAYFLLNCELGTSLQLKKQKIIIGIGANNLINTVYRNYLNRFRYYADEMGRNITVRIKIPLNYSRKN